METLKLFIEKVPVFWLVALTALSLLTFRAVVKYSIEFYGHSLKRPRFFSVHHPPSETAVYYVKTREADYAIVYYDARTEQWKDPLSYEDVDVFLWSYLPTTEAEYAPFKRHDEALEDASDK